MHLNKQQANKTGQSCVITVLQTIITVLNAVVSNDVSGIGHFLPGNSSN